MNVRVLLEQSIRDSSETNLALCDIITAGIGTHIAETEVVISQSFTIPAS